jgi:hypothetical protein
MKLSERTRKMFEEVERLPVQFKRDESGLLPELESSSTNILDYADEIEQAKEKIRDYRARIGE